VAALRSAQLFLGSITSTTPTTVYTVPAGKRAVIKFVTLQNTTGSAKNVQMRLSTLGTVWNWNLGAYGSGADAQQSSFWIVLNAGDYIQMNPTASGQIDMSISGSLLTV